MKKPKVTRPMSSRFHEAGRHLKTTLAVSALITFIGCGQDGVLSPELSDPEVFGSNDDWGEIKDDVTRRGGGGSNDEVADDAAGGSGRDLEDLQLADYEGEIKEFVNRRGGSTADNEATEDAVGRGGRNLSHVEMNQEGEIKEDLGGHGPGEPSDLGEIAGLARPPKGNVQLDTAHYIGEIKVSNRRGNGGYDLIIDESGNPLQSSVSNIGADRTLND